MATVLNVRQQLHDLCERVDVVITSYGVECSEPLRKALLSGLFTNVAEHRGEGKYHAVRFLFITSLSSSLSLSLYTEKQNLSGNTSIG